MLALLAAAAMSASAGAGLSSAAAPAPFSAAAASVPAGSVFVKLAGTPDRFLPVDIFVGDTVGNLAMRASSDLKWTVRAALVDLFLVDAPHAKTVEKGGSEGVAADKLFAGDKLATAGILDGSFVLARRVEASAAAPGECARTVRCPPHVIVAQKG